MREIVNIILLILLIIGGPVALLWCIYFEDADELMKKHDINDKEQQEQQKQALKKQALIDMMWGDEELGLYDNNVDNKHSVATHYALIVAETLTRYIGFIYC